MLSTTMNQYLTSFSHNGKSVCQSLVSNGDFLEELHTLYRSRLFDQFSPSTTNEELIQLRNKLEVVYDIINLIKEGTR